MTKGAPWTVGILAVLCGAAAWYALQEKGEIRNLRSALAAREDAAMRDQGEMRRLRAQLALYEEDSGPRERTATPAAEEAQAKSSRQVDLLPYFQRDPRFEELHRKRMFQQVRNIYGNLKTLNLDAEQQGRLVVLLANKINAPLDAREAALAQGITDGSTEMNRAYRDTMKSADDEIRTLVGDTGFQDLESLSKQISSRTMLNASLGREFIAAGQPLSADQVNALADARSHIQGTPDEVEQAVRERATQVLSPAQLDIFLQNRELERESRELQQRASEAATKETGSTSFHWGSW